MIICFYALGKVALVLYAVHQATVLLDEAEKIVEVVYKNN